MFGRLAWIVMAGVATGCAGRLPPPEAKVTAPESAQIVLVSAPAATVQVRPAVESTPVARPLTPVPAVRAPAPESAGATSTHAPVRPSELAPAAPIRQAARSPAEEPSPLQLTDEAIRLLIVQRSRASYSGSCACPDNYDRAGRRCGGRSAYSRPGGASPLCYPNDVTQAMIAAYQTSAR